MLYPINKTSNMWSTYHQLVLMYKLQQIHIPRRDLEEEQWLIRLLSRSTPKRQPLTEVSDLNQHKSIEKHKGNHKIRIRKTHIGLLLGQRVLKGLNRKLGR